MSAAAAAAVSDAGFADQVARMCYDRFQQLPQRGKPEAGREWSLLAAVLQLTAVDAHTVKKEVVSLGTGTKCIGEEAMSPRGDVLNDSHAEVIARRGCIRYLTEELRRAVSGGVSSVFCRGEERGKWKLRAGVSFVFFSSHSPCGDASIVPMTPPTVPVQAQAQAPPPGSDHPPKRKAEEAPEAADAKRRRLHGDDSQNASLAPADVHRTGAKCVSGGPCDPRGPGQAYHSLGALRVKPGRGRPTLSLSCSDKLARWGALGFQGALLAHYLQGGLYFSCVVLGACPYSQHAMHRALVSRCSSVSSLPSGFCVCPPRLVQSELEFPFSLPQTEQRRSAAHGRLSPCGAAISWCNVTQQPLDVTANGYKQGATKKTLGTAKARSSLCKLELFRSFLSLVAATEPAELPHTLRRRDLHTYLDYKQASESYQQAWEQLRAQAFPLWPRGRRELLMFDGEGHTDHGSDVNATATAASTPPAALRDKK